MRRVKFIHDGRHKGWRYREGEVVLLTDGLAALAISEGVARDENAGRERAVNAMSMDAIRNAKHRDS